MNVTKRDIVRRVADRLTFRQEDVSAVVDEFLDHVFRSLGEGADVELRGLGSFRVMYRGPRIGRNPRIPNFEMDVLGRYWVKFHAGQELRKKLIKLKQKKP